MAIAYPTCLLLMQHNYSIAFLQMKVAYFNHQVTLVFFIKAVLVVCLFASEHSIILIISYPGYHSGSFHVSSITDASGMSTNVYQFL